MLRTICVEPYRIEIMSEWFAVVSNESLTLKICNRESLFHTVPNITIEFAFNDGTRPANFGGEKMIIYYLDRLIIRQREYLGKSFI